MDPQEPIQDENVPKKQQKLSREEKKRLKFERRKSKKQEIRKKINKRMKLKLQSLDQEQKDKVFQIRSQAEQKTREAYESDLCVYVDLEYDVLMEDREVKSLALQVAHIVGINKELQYPIQLHLTNYRGIQAQELEKQGAHNWLIHKNEQSLEEIVLNNQTGKEFVYLSPDAEEDIQDIDPEHCIYIIGGNQIFKYIEGFVDRQVQKFMSLNKANTLQICAKKLPIRQLMQGKHNRPLNIDTVACLISEQYRLKNWELALNSARERSKCSVIHRLMIQNE